MIPRQVDIHKLISIGKESGYLLGQYSIVLPFRLDSQMQFLTQWFLIQQWIQEEEIVLGQVQARWTCSVDCKCAAVYSIVQVNGVFKTPSTCTR